MLSYLNIKDKVVVVVIVVSFYCTRNSTNLIDLTWILGGNKISKYSHLLLDHIKELINIKTSTRY